MYIKLSFIENVVIVPQCWAGMIVRLDKIELIENLPEGVKAGVQQNIKSNGNFSREDFSTKDYDLYIDCNIFNKNSIINAIKFFKDKISKNDEKSSYFVAGNNYPKENEISNKVLIFLQWMEENLFFKKSYSIMKSDSESKLGKLPVELKRKILLFSGESYKSEAEVANSLNKVKQFIIKNGGNEAKKYSFKDYGLQ